MFNYYISIKTENVVSVSLSIIAVWFLNIDPNIYDFINNTPLDNNLGYSFYLAAYYRNMLIRNRDPDTIYAKAKKADLVWEIQI